MKKNVKLMLIAAFMVSGVVVFAHPHREKRDGLDIAAGIVDLVHRAVVPERVYVVPQTVFCHAHPLPPRYRHVRPLPPPRRCYPRPLPPPRYRHARPLPPPHRRYVRPLPPPPPRGHHRGHRR